MSKCDPRMMPKDSEELKVDAPTAQVIVSLPALIKSASSSCWSAGYLPIPMMPFSLWNHTSASLAI